MATNRATAFPVLKSFYPWMIVCCGMMFYCYNYFLRVSPSVMQSELSHAFHINAFQFGTLAAFYYYAYTPMQIPAGMIYDKFGVRFVLCFAILLAVSGLAVFISADSFLMAGLGRFLIGLGTAFSYIGTLKLASTWLPANRFATAAGVTTAIGMLSGALSQKYLTVFVESIGYQRALHAALIAGIVLSGVIILLVRNRPKSALTVDNEMQTPMNLSQLLSALLVIFKNPQMWLIGCIGCLLYLPSSVFLDLWGIPFLKSVYPLTSEQVVRMLNFTSFGWIISCPIVGILSDKMQRRRLPLTGLGFFAAVLLCVVFYVPGLSINTLYVTFFLIGFCCGAHPLCFALGKESNPVEVSGTSVAVTNMLIMLGGVLFQPIVGLLLDLHTTSGVGADGLRIYSPSDYTFALSVVPIGVALGIFLSIFLKETYCQTQDSQKPAKNAATQEDETADLEPALEIEN